MKTNNLYVFLFIDRPEFLYWKKAGSISHPGGGGQRVRCFRTKTLGGWHRWSVGVLVWAAAASHRASAISADCLRGICCHWSHTPHIPSLPLSPTYLLLVPISISHFQIHTACTRNRHLRTDALGTPTHILKQTIYAGREEQKLEGCFFSFSDLSVLVTSCDLSMMYESPRLSEGPLI